MHAMHLVTCGVVLTFACGEAAQPCESELRSSTVSFEVSLQSWIHQPDLTRAIDLVFVAEGFTSADMPRFRGIVARHMSDLMTNSEGIVALAPERFNFHRLDTPSETSNVTNADRTDSYFGTCLKKGDDVSAKWWNLTGHIPRAREVAQASGIASADVVIVIINSQLGRARTYNSGFYSYPDEHAPAASAPSVVLLPASDDEATLTHELGHAIANLGDEYAEGDTDFSMQSGIGWAGDPLWTNANLTVERSGAKWANLATGTHAGGLGVGSGVFHPEASCRMNDAHSPRFCGVCREEIKRSIALHGELDVVDDPARIFVQIDAPRSWLWVQVFDRNLTSSVMIDGQSLAKSFLADGARAPSEWFGYFAPSAAAPSTIHVEIVDAVAHRSSSTMVLSWE